MTATNATLATKTTAEPIIATTDGKRVYLSNGGSLPIKSGSVGLPLLCSACEIAHIAQLWVWHWPTDMGAAGNDRWDVRENEQRDWVHTFRKGTNVEVDIVFPNRDTGGPWADANSAEDLLAGLVLYRRHVGIDWHRSGGATALRLLGQLHTGKGALPMRVTPMPAPALAGATESALNWIRALAQSERAMPWLHSYDKNGAYLGASAGDFPVGVGAPVPLTQGQFSQDTYKLPGYWLVSIDEVSRIPSFNHAKGKAGKGQQWVTTPTLAYAIERGAMVAVHQAFVWTRHHRPLEPWQKRLSAARTALMDGRDDYEPGARLALAAVKATYGEAIGWFASTGKQRGWDRSEDPYYRPDIRHMLIARARVNMLRKVDRMIAVDGITPLAIGGTDTVFIVSNEPDPWKAAPPSLTLGTTLRDFKPNPPIRVRDVYDILTGDLPPTKQLQALVKRVQDGKAGAA